jgi:hypothetical protein
MRSLCVRRPLLGEHSERDEDVGRIECVVVPGGTGGLQVTAVEDPPSALSTRSSDSDETGSPSPGAFFSFA